MQCQTQKYTPPHCGICNFARLGMEIITPGEAPHKRGTVRQEFFYHNHVHFVEKNREKKSKKSTKKSRKNQKSKKSRTFCFQILGKTPQENKGSQGTFTMKFHSSLNENTN